MAADWSAERVLALAPDAASAKAGQGLTSTKTWASLGQSEGLIWGECQGSGKQPYQTKVDPEEPAFSCSCPSRKFPCKHALGLMLIWAASPVSLTEGTPPEWVATWKEARAKKAEVKKEKAERPAAPVDAAAQAKRQAARVAKVAAGLEDLSLWLSDLVRQGFISLGARSRTLWDDQARRMIDAQAPGVARRLRQIDDMPFAGDGWHTALLDRLARLHLLAEGFQRREGLPLTVADDVRAAIGFPVDLDAARAGPSVRDRWQVVGHALATEDKVVVRRTWLLGRDTGRPALLLDFAAGNRPLDVGLPAGFMVDADLAFVPGSLPLRALVKERHAAPEAISEIMGGTTIAKAITTCGEAMAINPWLELFPIVLDNVVLQVEGESWSVRDPAGAVMPLSTRFARGWHFLALGGGGPITMSGEFDGETLQALGCHIDGEFVSLTISDMSPQETASVAMPVTTPLLIEATASAVVGVDRKPPPEPPPGSAFARALSGLEEQQPAPRLLAIAAAASLYGHVGRKATVSTSPAPEPCPPEVQVECGAEAANRLRGILKDQHSTLLSEWLDLLAASGRRVPHDLIVELFDKHHDRSLPIESLSEGIGVRGRWLAAKNPAWSRFTKLEAAADPVIIWETGTRQERQAALRSLRKHDPARARDLVASTFASEPADVRTAFLSEFACNLSMEDEPFLEAALDDRSKEVRRQSADLLRRLPTSRLCLRMIERARPLLAWKRGLIGLGRGSLAVVLPGACDKAMVRDGVEPKPRPGDQMGERAWWLREILCAIPTRAIAEMLGVSAVEIVEASRANEWKDALVGAWIASATRHRDADWADALLAASPGKPLPIYNPARDLDLFNALPNDRRDAYLLRNLGYGPLPGKHPATRILPTLQHPIGLEPARVILGEIRALVEAERKVFADPDRRAKLEAWSELKFDPTFHDPQIVRMIGGLARIIPLTLIDEDLVAMPMDATTDLAYESSFRTLIECLQFRRDMHRELAL